MQAHDAPMGLTAADCSALQQAYLKASNTEILDYFGHAVSISGDTVVIGAPQEDSSATGVDGNQGDNSALLSGAAYIFVRSGMSWSQQAYLKASNAGQGDQFGYSVSVCGDTVVVGAITEASSSTGVDGDQSDNSAGASGAAYVFVRSGTSWSQQAYLKASNTEWGDQFGRAVSVSGDIVVVGAYKEASGATGVDGDQSDNSAEDSGAAYVFVRSGTSWSQQAYLKASNTGTLDYFGYSVSVSGDTVVVGAATEWSSATGVDGDQSDNSAALAGAAYIFVRSGTSWSQQAYLKASNAESGDVFGYSVSVCGDSVVVGAASEASSATGVDGNQSDNSAEGSGAAYVFVRSGTSWSQQAYLKASNAESGDVFGYSVSVCGDSVVVGAASEASSATGVDGNQSDNSAPSSGAAYIFVRSGTSWSQRAYLKASNAELFDSVGRSVALAGDTAVVGGWGEDSSATGVDGDESDNSASASGAAYTFTIDIDPPDEPWADLGSSLAGSAAFPSLIGTGDLLPSTPVSLDLSNAKPFAPCYLVVGVSNLSAPFKGGVLVPFPNLLFGQTVDFFGEASFGGLWPAGIPSAFIVYFQYWIVDAAGPQGFAASNAISGTTP
jgi:hypothetical protein